MATLRSADVTVAAVAALKGNSALTTALGSQAVYSHLPEGTSAPYVLMGGCEERPWAEVFNETGDDGAREVTLWFEVVTDSQGLDQVEALSALAVAALTTVAAWAGVSGFRVVEFGQAQQPTPVVQDGTVYLTRPCAVRVYLS